MALIKPPLPSGDLFRYDKAFNSKIKGIASGFVRKIKVQPDGKILVGGSFLNYNGIVGKNYLLRFNSDGTEDTSFNNNLGTGFNGNVQDIALDTSGNIYIGGNFTSLNGTTRNRMVKLNSSGIVDTTFSSNLGSGFNLSVLSIDIEPTFGQIVVGGEFTTLNGDTYPRVVLLDSSGSVETTYYTYARGKTANGSVNCVKYIQGGILVGGDFTSFAGQSISYLCFYREPWGMGGASDFKSLIGGHPNSGLYKMSEAFTTFSSNDSVLITGNFTSIGGVSSTYVAKVRVGTTNLISSVPSSTFAPAGFYSNIVKLNPANKLAEGLTDTFMIMIKNSTSVPVVVSNSADIATTTLQTTFYDNIKKGLQDSSGNAFTTTMDVTNNYIYIGCGGIMTGVCWGSGANKISLEGKLFFRVKI